MRKSVMTAMGLLTQSVNADRDDAHKGDADTMKLLVTRMMMLVVVVVAGAAVKEDRNYGGRRTTTLAIP